MGKAIHILRYGTAGDKKILEQANDTYDYLAINGSTAAFVSKAISRLIVNKFFEKENKGYFIDPLTYAFQGNINLLKNKKKTDYKGSIKKLIKNYGNPIDHKISEGLPVTPEDFSDLKTCQTFCKNVLDFQRNIVRGYLEDNNLFDYLDYAYDCDFSISMYNPKFLIAPYFYISFNNDWQAWLNINKNMLEIAQKESNGIPVFAQIVIAKDVLHHPDMVDAIVSCYKAASPAGITIWIDDFSEQEEPYKNLQAFVSFLKKLRPIPVYNMYGGYFSIMLANNDVNLLAGVSHGIEYGESRSVYPVGGGVPTSKYYYPPLHKRISFYEAFSLLTETGYINLTEPEWGNSDKYYEDICCCSECKALLKNTMLNFSKFESTEFYITHHQTKEIRHMKASAETRDLCRSHYLYCKQREFEHVGELSLEGLLEELNRENTIYKDSSSFTLGNFSYISDWINILSNINC